MGMLIHRHLTEQAVSKAKLAEELEIPFSEPPMQEKPVEAKPEKKQVRRTAKPATNKSRKAK